MNSKIIIVLAIILIVISSFGILMTKEKKDHHSDQSKSDIPSKIFILTKDIKKGQAITTSDFSVEEKYFSLDEVQDSYIINKPITYIKDSIASTNLAAKTILKYEYISRNFDPETLDMLEVSNPNDLPFDFVLPSREFGIIQHIKKGELVDIYFRYEIKNKGLENTIIAKSKDNSTSRENANLTNLILLFKDKRVLGIRKDSVSKTSQNTKSFSDSGILILQMGSEEIRSIYAIENLGRFYIFPAKPQKTLSNGVSTQEVLSQDFIKELRGGDRR